MRRRTLAAALVAPALFTCLPARDVAATTVPLPVVGEARDVAVQSDGKIVAAFQAQSTLRFTVVRLLADGVTLDPTFGGDGIVETALQTPGLSAIQQIALQPDGRIVAAGYTSPGSGQPDFGLVRYRSDGSLDPTFGGGDGIAIIDLAGQDTRVSNLALTPDGSIIVAAQTDLPGGMILITRTRSDGSPDPAFGTGGIVIHDLPATELAVEDVASDGAGNAVIGGAIFNQNGFSAQHLLARVTTTGALDPTFGAGGVVTWVQGPGYGSVGGVAIQRDGRIVTVGFADNKRSETIARYLPTGQADPTFGTGGHVTTPIDGSLPGFDRPGRDVAVLRDGRIAIAGEARSGPPHLRLAVVTPNGSPDPTFDGDDGVVQLPLGDPEVSDGGGFLALTRTGGIVVAGTDRVAGGEGNLEIVAVPSLAPRADLTPIVTATPNPAPAGPVEFQVRVRNDGPAAAGGVSLDFELSQGISAVETDQGSCDTSLGFVASCKLGTLDPGREVQVTVTTFVTGFEEGVFGTARVDGSGYDPDPADDIVTLEVLTSGPNGE